MKGSEKSFTNFVKRQNSYISVVHCLLDTEILAKKKTQEDLAIVFKEVETVANYTKSRPLQPTHSFISFLE